MIACVLIRTILAAALGLSLSACVQTRLANTECRPILFPVKLDRASRIEGAMPPSTSFRDAIESAARGQPAIEHAQGAPRHLVLSGGGKWGSFGAGFLHALPSDRGYRIVTGVSTGALQASFAFLANDEVPLLRNAVYTAANDLLLASDAPRPGQGRRYLDDLPLAYTVARSESVILVKGGLVSAVRHGAAGDFAPLRRRLALLLDREMLSRIAAASGTGRGLFVGVIDVDDGHAYAVDMIDLAKRAVAPAADFEAGQRCYIEALVASSSEPLQASPVFFSPRYPYLPGGTPTSHMFIDGGVRAGVFLEEILGPDGNKAIEAARPRIDTTVLVNGNLTIDDRTADADWNKDWDLLRLAMRSKDILVDQIYQYSVDRVMRSGSSRGEVRLATSRGYESHAFAGRNCKAWRAEEQNVAFPPTFMRCLIDYGRTKALGDQPWDAVAPAPG